MKITIKDIAKMANVSTTTVSLVLNKRCHRVSKSKQEEILALAKKYNYHANLAARSLATSENKILGLILPDLSNLFFASLAQQLEQILRKLGYALFIMSNNENAENDLWLVNHLSSLGVAGILICPAYKSLEDDKLAKRLSNLAIPFVMVDRAYIERPLNKVYFDHEWGAYQAVNYLIKKGHHEIGCIAPPASKYQYNSRLNGYYKALTENQIDIKKSYVLEGDFRAISGYKNAKLLIEKEPITAIFSCNDIMTLGLLKYVNEQGLKIPDDLSVVSYDNIVDFLAFNIDISAVEQDVTLLAKHAVEILVNELERKDQDLVQEVCLKPSFVIKDSIKAPN